MLELLTKEGKVLGISPDTEGVAVLKEGVSFYKRVGEFQIFRVGEYLEILRGRSIFKRLHLFRGLKDVLISGHGAEVLIFLVGDNWIESIGSEGLRDEREFKERIVDVKIASGLVMVLHNGQIGIFAQTLKKLGGGRRLSIKCPDLLVVFETDQQFLGIFSRTQKSLSIFSAKGELVQTVGATEPLQSVGVFKVGEEVVVALGMKGKISITPFLGGEERVISTDHNEAVTEIVYDSGSETMYSISQEGVLCACKMGRAQEVEGAAVFVERRGLTGISVVGAV
ncbi:hypothetical protein NEDG_01167 [Nematocida displodere]|uniref:Uncharacterized protein n=1 Tax=Nematocida displodere TaxID=1805483 RepID=A0A177EB44_9MICR|nr:hypothetical protein NEDG_01167 [Nematocida displodere]